MPRTKCGFEDSPGILGSDALVQHGPTLLVDIGFDPTYVAPAAGVIPAPAVKGIWALVDTGATESCIDAQLADQLKLPIMVLRCFQWNGCRRKREIWA